MRFHVWCSAVAAGVVLGGGTALAAASPPEATSYTRVYTGEDGESHFETVSLPLEVTGGEQPIGRSQPFSAGDFSVISAPGDWDYTWHTAPRRQFIVVVSGTMEIEVHGGVTRRFGAGSLLLADDLTGRGHMTRSIGGAPLILAVVPWTSP